MRILLLIPLSILLFYLSWQGLKSEHGIDKAIHHNNNSTTIEQLNTSTLQHSPTLQPLTFICDRKSDSLELVKFYIATDSSKWWKKWDLKKPMNTWFGISLNAEGCVLEINLADTILNKGCCVFIGNNLRGSLDSLNLPNLIVLNLNANNLTDTIPNFSQLPNLQLLELGANQLSGSIPNFDKIPSLTYLGIAHNKLNGSIPNFDKLPKLSSLQLAENQLSGTIPNFDKIPMLERLGLGQNNLSDTIPNFNLTALLSLDLNNNDLTGKVPNFNNLPNLGSLVLHINNLTGPIPNFDKIPKLQSLLLFDNQLTDSIPNFDKIRNLIALRLDNNKLTGSIPKFQNLHEIVELWLNDNNLKGFIPDYSIFNPHLKLSYLYNNKLIFSSLIKNFSANKKLIEVSNVPSYGFIYFQQQKIYPDTTITIPNNTNYTLDLLIDDTVTTSTYTWYKNDVLYKTIKGSNKLRFTTFTSNDVGKYTVKINNSLAPQLTLESGSITINLMPMLVCDRKLDSLELLKFRDSTGGAGWTTPWDPTKPISTWWGVKLSSSGCVIEIDLRNSGIGPPCCPGNNLIGRIPNLNLSELQALRLQHEPNLKGPIPNSNLPNLIELTLFDCDVEGPLPNFDKMPRLKYLILPQNNISGDLPDFKWLDSLEILHLGTNSLTGLIPDFPSFGRLKTLELYDNKLSGTIPNFNLPSVECMLLNSNMLTGSPPDFSKCKQLNGLGLSNNLLSGFLPDYSLSTPLLSSFSIDVNKFTFAGLTRNTLKVESLTTGNGTPKCTSYRPGMLYQPQMKIFVDTTINISPCTDYILDLKIDDTVTTSTYAWFKDGSPFKTIKGSNKLQFSGFNSSNNGTYTVTITNLLAPQLTLTSNPIRLFSGGSVVNINNPKDTTLPCGLSFILNQITGQNLTNAAYFTGPGRTGTQYSAGQVITSSATLYLNAGSGNCSDEDTFKITFTNKTNIILKPDLVIVKYQTPKNFDVLANDIIPGGIAVMVTIDRGTNGDINIISQSTGKGTYTPSKGFSGKEILNYKVCPVSCPDACSTSTIEFDVEPPCNDKTNLVLPNVIFPEGSSGDNRYFIVEALNKCPEAFGPKPTKFMVYNRWGDQVYHSNDYKNDWDGNNDGGHPLPAGTYYYLLDLGGVSAPVKGYVVIMR